MKRDLIPILSRKSCCGHRMSKACRILEKIETFYQYNAARTPNDMGYSRSITFFFLRDDLSVTGTLTLVCK